MSDIQKAVRLKLKKNYPEKSNKISVIVFGELEKRDKHRRKMNHGFLSWLEAGEVWTVEKRLGMSNRYGDPLTFMEQTSDNEEKKTSKLKQQTLYASCFH